MMTEVMDFSQAITTQLKFVWGGTSPHELKLGCDCLGEIHYFSHHGVNWNGEVKTTENAICMHEEDYGVLWKHHDWVTQQTEVRRSRRLVISTDD